MFERFTRDARAIVVDAQARAAEIGSARIDPLHLLAGFGRKQGGGLLAGLGVSPSDVTAEIERVRRRGGMSDSDVEALAGFGIDVGQIVERVEQAHGPWALAGGGGSGKRGHIPFTAEAKKTLETSLGEALDIGDKFIGEEHLLLALAALPGPAADVLAQLDIDHPAVRRAVQTRKAG
ncbi:Clp protease N-terminal domain-containing protein [Amycolatopsis sp. H20-H5]|uniref:Clp protease N-terminal domain-containing protein n=1 Tax=Amycolatopsis sp. H20-H5 TaxID=3046309 RepID=UPI002DBEE5AE|nr:Clp protease N-terminal domain-containing protein [Amycolatopsis sp. H20-H5]MEC3975398.1 Clp protease N-terminal domain-containing protein [Amycolatopsis sp. H20-H5]